MDNDTMCCPLDGGDFEQPGFYEVDIIRARRSRKHKADHECTECGQVIPCGSMHERLRYAERRRDSERGYVSTYRTCLLCVEIRTHFSCGNSWVIGELWSQLEENFFPDMKCGGQCMTGLSPEAKRVLIDRRVEWYYDGGEREVDGAMPPWYSKKIALTLEEQLRRLAQQELAERAAIYDARTGFETDTREKFHDGGD